MYKEFKVDFTPAQAKKILQEKPVRLRADQLGVGPSHYFHPLSHKALVKAYEHNKGLTLYMTHGAVLRTHLSGLSGGSFWSSLVSGARKAFSWAKNSGLLSRLADMGATAAAPFVGGPQNAAMGRAAVKSLTGIGMQTDDLDGGRLTMSDIKKHAVAGFNYAKKKGIVSDVIDQGEKYLISKGTKPEHTEMIKAVRGHIRTKYGVGMTKKGRRKALAVGGSFRLA